MQVFTDGLLKDHKLVVHIVTEDNVAAKILRDTRDLCNSEVRQLLNCETAPELGDRFRPHSFLAYQFAIATLE